MTTVLLFLLCWLGLSLITTGVYAVVLDKHTPSK